MPDPFETSEDSPETPLADSSGALERVVVTPATTSAATGRVRRKRRHRSRWRRIRRIVRPFVALLIVLAVVFAVWTSAQVFVAWNAYQASRTDVDRLQAQTEIDPATVSRTQLATLQTDFQDLSFNLRRLDGVANSGLARAILGHVPWVAPRYQATQQLLTIGVLLSTAGGTGAGIAQKTVTAFEQTGVMEGTTPSSATWLDVLSQQQQDIDEIARQVGQAQRLRTSLNTAVLPGSVRNRIGELDRLLNRYDVQHLADTDLPTLVTALGEQHDTRYLVLFQNPEELRPAGGFPGTIALVTLSRGQIESYDFSDVQTLTADYMRERSQKIAQPWPIQQYFPQDGFLIQDATWFADFPQSGAQVMSMYAETSWPAINGVIAVQPGAVSEVLKVIGNVTIDVDGEQRTITPENVLNEVERQRRLGVENQPGQLQHKQVLALIGDMIIAHVKHGNRAELMQIARGLEAAAGRRDIQAYTPDQTVESLLDKRGWSGRIVPTAGVATLAVNFANLVLVKDSLRMDPSLDLQLGPSENGARMATLTIQLKNTGTTGEDPFYAGFQKWWVEVTLPDGSSVAARDPASLPDPAAPNGGSYRIDLFPQETGKIVIRFSMPDVERLLVRRQPGVHSLSVDVSAGTCQISSNVNVTRDEILDLHAKCP